MNKFFLGACICAAATLTACSGNPPAYNEPVATQPMPMPGTAPANAFQTDSTGQTIVPVNPAAGAQTVTAVPTPQQAPAQQAKAAKGMNPEHGQPGHRCDIPVGAPLNSPVANTAQPQVQQVTPANQQVQVGPQITPIQPAKPALPTAGSGRVNPAHGEPGHDCAVPVGAPLN
ncbi:hypothetical protein [Aridibaculum aurantiacum]|uniref:hypothetical protein n=1 Tax=Aridibaculum aurantiacum TaxID=2810307 RepID=UPI001A977A36|nr:hypothetical protein [Aridibaculum aurantiacum]